MTGIGQAATRNVPGSYATIQAAINACADGDVDLDDFIRFTRCFNGPNNAPACE